MRSPEILGIISAIMIIPILFILKFINVIEFTLDFNLFGIPISIISAVSIPVIYNYIQQHRKKSRVKKFCRNELRIIKSVHVDEKLMRNTIKESILNLESIENYITDVYDEIEFNNYLNNLRMIKDSIDNNTLTLNIKLHFIQTLENLLFKN